MCCSAAVIDSFVGGIVDDMPAGLQADVACTLVSLGASGHSSSPHLLIGALTVRGSAACSTNWSLIAVASLWTLFDSQQLLLLQ